ncbi:hypothetical protein L596_017515 [Steinernema carpocapsae]|uniref:Uncharacterized protein n=1 Tax=Steinernema carpocapsae TaxID=34508 RepID=A0A4U5N1X2_STECR|nr:hypothetical protein L596_017515 [Steinernema carpocapsae]
MFDGSHRVDVLKSMLRNGEIPIDEVCCLIHRHPSIEQKCRVPLVQLSAAAGLYTKPLTWWEKPKFLFKLDASTRSSRAVYFVGNEDNQISKSVFVASVDALFLQQKFVLKVTWCVLNKKIEPGCEDQFYRSFNKRDWRKPNFWLFWMPFWIKEWILAQWRVRPVLSGDGRATVKIMASSSCFIVVRALVLDSRSHI